MRVVREDIMTDATNFVGRDHTQSIQINAWFYARFAFLVIGLFAALLTPPVMAFAVRISQLMPDQKDAVLGIVLGIGAIFALLSNPLAGMLSDRTKSRFGRRRPWMVGGIIVAAAAMFLISNATTVPALVIGWCIAQVGFNAVLACVAAVIPDSVPEEKRGRVSAIFGMGANVGIMVGVTLVNIVGVDGPGLFLAATALAIVAVLLFVFTYPDPQVEVQAERLTLGKFAGTFWVNPIKFKDFGWAWLSRFLFFFGVSTLLSFQVFLLLDVYGVTQENIEGTMLKSTLITTVAVILASIGSGIATDVTGKRKIFVFLAAVIYAVGLAYLVLNPSMTGFFIGVAICSVGFGVYLSVDHALVVDVLPNRETEAAKNMGVFNIATAVPQALAPALAPVILGLTIGGMTGYTLLFLVAALVVFVAAVAILPVRGSK